MRIYYAGIRRYIWVVFVSTAIAVIASFLLARSQLSTASASSIVIVDADAPNTYVTSLGGQNSSIDKNSNYAAILSSRSALNFVYQSYPEIHKRGYSVDYLMQHLSASASAANATITITVTASNADDATTLTNSVANGFVAYIQNQYQQQLDAMRSDLQKRLVSYQKQNDESSVHSVQTQLSQLPLSTQSDVHVLQLASTDTVTGHKSFLIVGAAAAMGLLLGAVVMLLLVFIDDRLQGEEQVKEKLGLAYVGNVHKYKDLNINSVDIPSPMTQDFANIWANLYLAGVVSAGVVADRDRAHKGVVLLVTSARPAVGKTTLAVGLASVIVKDGSSVVVVDGNLRQPSTHLAFGLGNVGPGLSGLLEKRNGANVDSVVLRSRFPGAWLLPAGTSSEGLTLLLKRELPGIVEQLREKVDVVVIDAAPLLSGADASLMATMSDGVILVVDSRYDRLPMLLRAKALLASLPHKPAGAVLNYFAGHKHGQYFVSTVAALDGSDGRSAVGEADTDGQHLGSQHLPGTSYSAYTTGSQHEHFVQRPFLPQDDASRSFSSDSVK